MLSRRLFLQGASALGCSAAAHPLLSTVTFAAAPGDNRLVVIVLRGAMDGLHVLQPYGDPLLARLRPGLKTGPGSGAHDLDGFYALNPALGDLLPLWRAGQLGFAQAVSTPYRDKRSHFDGQDILEAGTGGDLPPAARRDGWLNRLVGVLPDATSQTAFSVGIADMPILAGAAPHGSWAPEADLTLSPQAALLLEQVYADDPLFRAAAAEAVALDAMGSGGGAAHGTAAAAALGAFTAERLRAETRIAAFSLNGWDTHKGQEAMLARALASLQAAILAIRENAGQDVWDRTLILAMTEFGRTARENGTAGTDHGTGGTLIMAGGALNGGRVYGRWPGLRDSDLYEGRDLMPLEDVRAYAGWAMRGLFGLGTEAVTQAVFPGLDLGRDPGILT